MKRKLLFGFLLLAYAFGNAQFQIIDDPAFEDELIRLGHDSNPLRDGGISLSDAEAVTFLNLTGVETNDVTETFTAPGLGITNLTGIKAFTNLEVLWAQQNNLVELDLEGMTSLTDVRAFNNNLARINIKGLVNLDIIGLNNNSISGINVSTNTNLRQFDVAQNNLLYLDISGLSGLTEMNVQNNALLACIQVESAARATALNGNANFRKNGATTFSNTCTPIYTQIPDRNFETALISNGMDTDGGIPDGLVLTADISDEINLDISSQGITDLTGLEAFSNLEILDVSNNNLNALRLQNVSLIEIYANDCNLAGKPVGFQNNPPVGSFLTNVTTLELQNNNLGIATSTFSFGGVPNVQTLNVSGNNFGTLILGGQTNDITNLIASNCPNLNTLTGLGSLSQLQELTIDNSNFTTLDFSGLDVLSTLRINTNNFTSLNLKDIDDTLTTLNTTGNPNLNCIEVSNIANAEAQGTWQIDAGSSYSTNCNPQPFTVTASILGAMGTSPNFEITEGSTFTLNFESSATATAGTQYIPNIQFTLNGNNTTADFTFNGTTDIPNTPFTVSSANPDGSITILAEDEGVQEGNETYTITISSPDPSLFTIEGPTSFEVTVRDNSVPPDLLQVEATLGGGEGSPNNYSILEGDFLYINFNILSTITEAQEFPVEFQVSGIAQPEDYILPTNPGTFTTSTFNSFAGSLSFEIVNDFPLQELGETIIITLPKPISDYEWANAEADGSLKFEVNITDSSSYNEPNFEVELIGNTEFVDGIYYITEGDALEFWIESNTLNNNQEITYELTTDFISISGNADEGIDYNITSLPLEFQVNNGANPDTKISIETIDDDFRNNPKDIILTFFSNDEIPFQDATVDFPIRYFIRVNDNDNNESSISAILDNTGSLEGGANDVFTLSLTNSDGTPYLAEENLTFEINFSPTEGPNGEKAADIGDFIPVDDATQIIIPQGFSKGTIEVQLPIETGNNIDDVPEYYLATLTNVTSQIFILSEPLLVKILDPGTKFEIFLTAFTTNPINSIYKGSAIFSNPSNCCPTYSIEEGSSFKIGFEAEKGVPLNSNYTVITSFAELGEGGNEGIVTAEEGIDYQNKNPSNTATYISKTEMPDNVLQIDIFSDQDEQRNGTEVVEDKEYFFLSITLDENDKEKYRLVDVGEASGQPAFPSAAEIYITQVIPVVIPELSYEVTEIDSETNIVRVKVSVDRESFVGYLEVAYELSGSAIEGDDYEIIGPRNIVFDRNKDAYIDIKILNDNNVENDEQIIITLLNDRGYSVSNSSNRAVVTILQNDQDLIEYSITLSAEPSQITEIEGSNQGVFTITVTPLNDPESNLLVNDVFVNYEFIDNGEPNPAIEGLGNDFIQSGNGQIIFQSGGPNTKEIIVTALADPNIGVEPVETITLSLRAGSQYSAENTNPVSLEIISTEVDTSRLLSTDIQVTVATNTCANTNEGDIIIKNNSGLDIRAEIASENKSVLIEKTKEDKIKNLPAGRHLVTFSFVDETVDLLPPSFEVFIAELSGTNLIGKQVNLNSKTASLKVAGSKEYTIVNGNDEHYFEFNDFLEKTISIPISNGINDILIKGEAACQGVVKTQVFLNEFVVFPNPTESFVTFSGFLLEEDATISISDVSGKNFLNTTRQIITESVQIDLSKYPPGLYYGRIKTESGQDLRFKILKD